MSDKSNAQPSSAGGSGLMFARLPGGRFIANLNIGAKLSLAFGLLVVFTVMLVVLNYIAGNAATLRINTTSDVRADHADRVASRRPTCCA
jgi:hypothetical protein